MQVLNSYQFLSNIKTDLLKKITLKVFRGSPWLNNAEIPAAQQTKCNYSHKDPVACGSSMRYYTFMFAVPKNLHLATY